MHYHDPYSFYAVSDYLPTTKRWLVAFYKRFCVQVNDRTSEIAHSKRRQLIMSQSDSSSRLGQRRPLCRAGVKMLCRRRLIPVQQPTSSDYTNVTVETKIELGTLQTECHSTSTQRNLNAEPVPHICEHSDHSLQPSTWQSVGHGMWHGRCFAGIGSTASQWMLETNAPSFLWQNTCRRSTPSPQTANTHKHVKI